MTTLEIAKQYGCDARTLRRVNEAGRAAGILPPWSEGPAAMIDWHQTIGRKLPDWLRDAAGGVVPEPVEMESPLSVDGEALESNSVEVMDSLIAAYSEQIEAMKKQGIKGAALAAMGKDYSKLCIARDKMKSEARKYDDNLIDKAAVIDAADRLHASIPGRLEDELVAGLDEITIAHQAGKGREFIHQFLRDVLASLAGSFAEQLKDPA